MVSNGRGQIPPPLKSSLLVLSHPPPTTLSINNYYKRANWQPRDLWGVASGKRSSHRLLHMVEAMITNYSWEFKTNNSVNMYHLLMYKTTMGTIKC